MIVDLKVGRTIGCEGRLLDIDPTCDRIFAGTTETRKGVRGKAAAKGWTQIMVAKTNGWRAVEGFDLCPSCTAKHNQI